MPVTYPLLSLMNIRSNTHSYHFCRRHLQTSELIIGLRYGLFTDLREHFGVSIRLLGA